MAISPLLIQLAHRAQQWHSTTGISQSMMASAIGMSESNYSSFLGEKRGLGSESTCLLLKFLRMPRREAVMKLTQSPITAKIMCLQEQGEAMELDVNSAAWVPGLSGIDPKDSSTIDDSFDPTSDTLRALRGLYRQMLDALDAGIAKAKPNPNGGTAPNSQKFGC
jgi:hypothetical protein